MKHKMTSRTDVLMIYQEKQIVDMCIKQITDLELKFASFKMDLVGLDVIQAKNPKVLLISSNDIKHSIEYYIDYLEEYEQHIAPHRAIILINNRETLRAFLACENGLFDDYAIVNPLNEPYRLKLGLLQQLKIIDNHKSDGLTQLNEKGEDELASCIEHGVTLKKAFINEVDLCKKSLLGRANDAIVDKKIQVLFEKISEISLDELHHNMNAKIDVVIDELNKIKDTNNQQGIRQVQGAGNKSQRIRDVNAKLLLHDEDEIKLSKQEEAYKILIVEPCSSFAIALEKVFSDAGFKCSLVTETQFVQSDIATFLPDIILAAYEQCGLNGIELTREIRQKGIQTPIVAYVHKRDSKVMNQWIKLGLSNYLIKPMKKNVLLKTVDEAIKYPIAIMECKYTPEGDKIQWIPAYSIGNKEIDEQHKILFEMINEFFFQDGKEAAISIFDNLSSYIDLHFEAEESLLKQINYPKTAEHIAIHDELRVKFARLLKKLDDYSVEVHHKIALFLYNWLASHILKSDMDYKAYAISLEESSFM